MIGKVRRIISSERGFALVFVLMIVTILIAMVTDFAYTVHEETVALYQWRDLQSLSLESASGISLGEQFLRKYLNAFSYTYPGRVDMPLQEVAGEMTSSMVLTVIDESGKINLNKLVDAFGRTETSWHYAGFERLLKDLELDESIADIIADWIDKDSEERLRGSETRAKNGPLYSLDELIYIPGIGEDVYKKLIPHVTIFGDGLVNINSADEFVLTCLSDGIDATLAKRVIAYREYKPFRKAADILRVSGFGGKLGTSLMGRVSVKGTAFSVTITASAGDLRRSVSAVIDNSSGSLKYKYWREI